MIGRLKGLRVMVVEDQSILAQSLADALEEKGASILGVIPDLRTAMEATAGDDPCDVVVLDLKLVDGLAVDLGADLLARGIPVVFTSAYPSDILDERHTGARYLTKPFNFYDAVLAVAQVMTSRPAEDSRAGAGEIPGWRCVDRSAPR